MGEYLRIFNNMDEYLEAKGSLSYPNVSYIQDGKYFIFSCLR